MTARRSRPSPAKPRTRAPRRGSDSARPAPAAPPPAWLLRCAPGLAQVLRSELRHARLLPRGGRAEVLWQRNHDLLFLPRLARAPGAEELRIAEDIFRCPIYGRYKISDSQLDRLAAQLRAQGRRWRIVVTAEGRHFNRHDLARWLAKALGDRGLRIDDAQERAVFVFCVDQAYYVAVQQRAAREVAGRGARRAEREGSLPPGIAAAMAFLGRAGPEDVILDPVCGSGTLLAEARAYAPGARLLGLDTDAKAVKAARQNLAESADVQIDQGDARDTGLPAATVTLVLGNLPFGKQYGDPVENRALYGALLEEMRRLAAASGWRAVLLAADDALLAEAARERGLRVDRRVPVRVRGESAAILVLRPD